MTKGQAKTVEKQKVAEKPQKRLYGEVALLGVPSNPRSIVSNNGNLHSYIFYYTVLYLYQL